MAEGVGFEPTEGTGPSTAFKAAAFVHSATPPAWNIAYLKRVINGSMLTDVMNKRHGKGWVYAGIVPLATLLTGEIQPQGRCYLFKRPQVQVSPKQKQSKRKK
jgi:hypothetical protein